MDQHFQIDLLLLDFSIKLLTQYHTSTCYQSYRTMASMVHFMNELVVGLPMQRTQKVVLNGVASKEVKGSFRTFIVSVVCK